MSDSHDQALARSQARRRRRIDHSELAKEREKAFYRFVHAPTACDVRARVWCM